MRGGFDKLSAVVTDGGAMQGKRTGFGVALTLQYRTASWVTLLLAILMVLNVGILRKKNKAKSNFILIWQEALCARSMNFSHAMDLVTKTTNLIGGGNRSLNHRKCVSFVDEVKYGDLQSTQR